jgi:hypothetical protein
MRMIQASIRSVGFRFAVGLVALVALARALLAGATVQDSASAPPGLVNGGMETLDDAGELVGWRAPAVLRDAGYAIGPEREDVFGGAGAARIDSRAAEGGANLFGNLMQSVDAAPYHGKRVRYRAAVKVAEAEAGGQAQLWLRVDLAAAGGAPRMGFFDNMGDRPITSGEWQTYEIVGDVAPDAQRIVLGTMTLGQCLVLVDEATLEVVGAEAAPTTSGDALANAPTQPFFTPWLVLPLVALVLFGLGFLGCGRVGTFALAFTFVYWTLYALPTLVASLVPWWGGAWSMAFEAGPVDGLVRWTAASVLGVEGELVPAIGNGSGDTTHSYVQAFLTFVLALAAAVVWVLVRRDASDHARARTVLRTGLRYYLAIFMVSYGLAKLGTLYNQFSAPGLDRLARTYGESSPMGLVWTFMGSSRAYTAFAGAMELLGGVLLVWRRTALLGALVSVGVMLNVMLMNFCYDVPVKLFSFHLVVAGACIALPDARRLGQLFLGLGGGAPAALASAPTRRWLRRAAQAYVVVMVLALPLLGFWRRERAIAGAWPALGEWKLTRLEEGGQPREPEAGELERLTLSRRAVTTESGWTTDFYSSLVGGSAASGTATLTADTLALSGGAGTSRLLGADLSWRVDGAELHLETPALHATFAPATHDFLLMRRGFRWINERPFNR